jgi:hypothetical protein
MYMKVQNKKSHKTHPPHSLRRPIKTKRKTPPRDKYRKQKRKKYYSQDSPMYSLKTSKKKDRL